MRFLFLILILYVTPTCAQDLIVEFAFVDTLGNVDTIVAGVAEDATYGYESQYDGANLFDTPRGDGLSIRILGGSDQFGGYETKLQIGPYFATHLFEVVTDHWPVTVSWKATGNLDDPRLNYSGITENSLFIDGNRFENQTGLSYTFLNLDRDEDPGTGMVTFGRRDLGIPRILASGDTAHQYYIVFQSRTTSTNSGEVAAHQLRIFPNPVSGQEINLTGPLLVDLRSATLFDVNGRRLRHYGSVSDRLTVSDLSPGLYFLRFQDKQGRYWSQKLMKR